MLQLLLFCASAYQESNKCFDLCFDTTDDKDDNDTDNDENNK